MKKNLNHSTYHGEFINNRLVKGLFLAEALYAPNLKLKKHSHPNPGFCLIIRGGYTESYEKVSLECTQSHVKFQPAGEPHSDLYGETSVHSFIIELEPAWLNQMGARRLVGDKPKVFRNNSIACLMQRLRREFHSTDMESPLIIEALVLELIAEASRQNRMEVSANKPPRWIRQAKDFIDEQYFEPLSLSVIAELVGVHPVYLATTFKRHFRCSIGEYLRLRRVEFAGHKISSSSEPLVKIALDAGFSNQSHFSRIFKQVTGMSPAQYRAACQKS